MNTEIASLNLANSLREYGYKVEIELTGRKIKKCFEYADRESIPYVIVIGEEEVSTRRFKIKNMETKEELEISLDDLEKIKEIIQK